MEKSKRKDYQTVSLFIILTFLTLVLVLGARVVLFAPNEAQHIESIEAGKALPIRP